MTDNNRLLLELERKIREINRETYEETVHGTKAMETAIQRGYLDVKTREASSSL